MTPPLKPDIQHGFAPYFLVAFVIAAILIPTGGPSFAQEGDPSKPKTPKSPNGDVVRRYREILQMDPGLDMPLDKLVELYSRAKKLPDLVALYKADVIKTPDNVSVRIVYARLLLQRSNRISNGGSNRGENLNEARIHLEKATQLDKESVVAWQFLSTLEEAAEQPDRAAEAIRESLKWAKRLQERVRLLERLGRLEIKAGRPKAAVAVWDRLIQEAHDNSVKLDVIALMEEARFYEEAVLAYRKMLEGKVSTKSALRIRRNLADLLGRLGRTSDALELYGQVLSDLAPGHWLRVPTFSAMVKLGEKTGTLDDVDQFLKRNIEEEGGRAVWGMDLARLRLRRGDSEGALGVLKEMLEEYPGDREVEETLLLAFRRAGKTAEEEALLVSRAERSPRSFEAKWALIQLKIRTGHSKDAEPLLESIRPGPGKPGAADFSLREARLWTSHRIWDRASRAYTRVLESFPEDIPIRREAATVLMQEGRRREAIEVLTAMPPEDLEPNDVADIADALTAHGLYEDARLYLGAAETHHPSSYLILVRLGDACRRTGAFEQGDKALLQALKLADSSSLRREVLELRIELYRESNRMDQLITEAKDVSEDRLQSAQARADFGAVLAAAGHKGEALRIYEQLQREDKAGPDIRAALADLYVSVQKNHAAAAKILEDLLQVDPYNAPRTRVALARIYIDTDQVKRAKEVVQPLLKSTIPDPNLYTDMAGIFRSSSEPKVAIKALERAYELAPEEQGILRRLLSLLTKTADKKGRIDVLRLALAGNDIDMNERVKFEEDLWTTLIELAGRVTQGGTPEEASEALDYLEEARSLRPEFGKSLAAIEVGVRSRLGDEKGLNAALENLANLGEEPIRLGPFRFSPKGLAMEWENKKSSPTSFRPVRIPRPGMERTWALDLGTTPDQFARPVLGKNVIFLRRGAIVLAIETPTGRRMWRKQVDDGGASSHKIYGWGGRQILEKAGLTRAGDRLYLAGKRLHCLNETNGDVIWSSMILRGKNQKGGRPTTPVVLGDLVAVYDRVGKTLFGFERNTGKLRWRLLFDTNSKMAKGPLATAQMGFVCRLVVADHRLVVLDGAVSVIDPKSGTFLWGVGGMSRSGSWPSLTHHSYVPSQNVQVQYGRWHQSSRIRFSSSVVPTSTRMGTTGVFTDIALHRGRMVLIESNGALHCWDLNRPSIAQWTLPSLGGGRLFAWGNSIAVANDRQFTVVQLLEGKKGTTIRAIPAVDPNHWVGLGIADSFFQFGETLRAYDKKGAVQWEWTLPDPIEKGPIRSQGWYGFYPGWVVSDAERFYLFRREGRLEAYR